MQLFGLAVLVCVGVGGPGCRSAKLSDCCTAAERVLHQVVAVDRHGHLTDPRTDKLWLKRHGCHRTNDLALLTPEVNYLKGVVDEVVRFSPPSHPGGPRQVLVLIHGGLNTEGGRRDRAVQMTRERACGRPTCRLCVGVTGKDMEYPAIPTNAFHTVLVNWPSGLYSSYGEHLGSIRQGFAKEGLHFRAMAPLYLAADVGSAAARLPRNVANQFHTDAQPLGFLRSDESSLATNRTDELLKAYQTNPAGTFPICIGGDFRSWEDRASANVSYVTKFPLRFVTTYGLDAGGKSAWDTMLRRTKVMFDGTDEFALTNARNTTATGSGGMARFMDALLARLKEPDAAGTSWEITLVGHSMGTIVASELLNRYGPRVATTNSMCPNVRFKDIVFMAAACDFLAVKQGVLPYLERDREARFYNLTLHPETERMGKLFQDTVTRGSLLIWIDNFLATPLTPLERTFGKWENAMAVAHQIPEGLRPRVTFKAFGCWGTSAEGKPYAGAGPVPPKSKDDPGKHGDFDNKQFWTKEFWSVPGRQGAQQ